MQKSESIAQLAAALSKAQGEIRNAAKSADNSFFHSKYADLASVWDAIRGPFSGNGIGVIQLPSRNGNLACIETMLTHGGEFISERLETAPGYTDRNGAFIETFDPQAVKSAFTYLRRIALESMAGVAPEDEDDDGNAASGRDKPDQRQQRREVAAEKQKENPPALIAPASELNPTPPVMMGDSWKRVVCHVGTKTKGRRVEEFGRATLEYLANEWQPTGKKPIEDSNLKHAVSAAIAELSPQWAQDAAAAQEAPASEPEATTDTDTPPAQETPTEKPAMEWRSVVCTIGNATKGRALGDISIQARGNDPKVFDDGPALLRALLIQGVPMLEKKGDKATIQEKILANAIKAAVAELNPFDNEAWLAERNEDELRNEVTRRVVDSGAAPDKLDAAFEEAAAKFSDCNEAQLRFLLKTWNKIVESAKGAK